jgi:hypothetical protein
MAAEATVRKMKSFINKKKGIKNSSETSSIVTESMEGVSMEESSEQSRTLQIAKGNMRHNQLIFNKSIQEFNNNDLDRLNAIKLFNATA